MHCDWPLLRDSWRCGKSTQLMGCVFTLSKSVLKEESLCLRRFLCKQRKTIASLFCQSKDLPKSAIRRNESFIHQKCFGCVSVMFPVSGMLWKFHGGDWLHLTFIFTFSYLRRFGALHGDSMVIWTQVAFFSEPPAFGVAGRVWLMDQFNGISSDPSLIKGSARNTVKQF